jgi:hypothetical protein
MRRASNRVGVRAVTGARIETRIPARMDRLPLEDVAEPLSSEAAG